MTDLAGANKPLPLFSLPLKELRRWAKSKEGILLAASSIAIFFGVPSRILGFFSAEWIILVSALILSGTIILFDLLKDIIRKDFSSDFLAGISIVTAICLEEYWAAILVVFMLSGGQSLERLAMKNASAILQTLAQRMPHHARRRINGSIEDISLDEVQIGDLIEVHPHDICPVDGIVIDGRSSMDEAFLTGEPYVMPKVGGSTVISGAINGEGLLTIRASALARDSRYQKIAEVIEQQATKRVRMRRIADSIASWYTPFGLIVALLAWGISGDPIRFLSVLVVATPCPLIIGIPVAIIGAISSAARKGIIIRDPASLEAASTCSAMILDKTGTLTIGKPQVTSLKLFGGWNENELLPLLLSAERYSKHPLATAIVAYAELKGCAPLNVATVEEQPGKGLLATIDGQTIEIGKWSLLAAAGAELSEQPQGPSCSVIINGAPAALLTFRDIPRRESRPFVEHLAAHHGIRNVMMLSGDRDTEAQYLASQVGITNARGGLSPEEKLLTLQEVMAKEHTIFIGDGINDAPSLQAATVGIGLGTKSDIIGESADVIILEPSLERVDAFLHLSRRVRKIALQTGLGGIALSIIGMGAAAAGFLPPVIGACVQEGIDLLSILNALRTTDPAMTQGDTFSVD
jgi:heavy metal translocating P-type ATPase